jgi:zinc protease
MPFLAPRSLLCAAALAVAAVDPAAAAPPSVSRHTLPNGLEVLVAENHSLPLFSVEVGVKNGAMTEPPEYNGLSHLYEHMFFKANAALPDQLAYMARTRELGMSFNGTTSNERVNYYFTTTSDHFADAMVFMRDAITSPLFDGAELERERVVVTGEIDRNEANPVYHLMRDIEERVWWKYPSRKWAIGTRASVLAATPEMMRTIQRRYYLPNNAVLVVVGDVRAEEVFAMADTLYAGWARGEPPFVKYPLVVHPPIPRSQVLVVEQPVATVNIAFNWIGPSALGPDEDLGYAADRLALVLQEPSSRFRKATVDSGACVSSSFAWETSINQGGVRLSGEATPDQADACVSALRYELARMKEPDYVSDEELESAVRRAEVDKARERERPSEFAHVLSGAWCVGGLDYYNGYVANLRRVGRPEIARFLDRFVLAQPFVLGVLLSPELRQRGLDPGHFEKLAGLAPAPPPAPAKDAAGKRPTKRRSQAGGRP